VDELISRRLAHLYVPIPEMKAGEWLYLCVAYGNDDAMEVCLVHTTTSTVNLTDLFFAWEALLRYTLHFAYRRQRDCLVKLTTQIFF
jgi:hypothetical protein